MTTPREELEEIIINMNLPVWNYLINKIISWHEKWSGNQKKWCNHILWIKNLQIIYPSLNRESAWVYQGCQEHCYADYWDQCPECNAPRPADE